jgi:hypothetical protein
MIRHIAVFRWHEGTTPEQIDAVREGLDALPGTVDSIRSYAHGPDLRLGDGRWDYVVIAEFDDVAGYHAYVEHPTHVAVRSERIAPLVADRAQVQIVS